MQTPLSVYLDYNATTPVDERVLQAMLPYFTQQFGNADSRTHSWGWAADQAVQDARLQLAQLIQCEEQELIFTSGATEACNLAIKGVFQAYAQKGNHIITAATEHSAVLATCRSLEMQGAHVTYLPVMPNGLIDLAQLEAVITNQTILVAIMWANNETGVIQPIDKIAELVHAKGSIFMSDATQAVGKIPIDLSTDRVDLLCLSAHKFYGPKGIGALYKRRKNPRVTIQPQQMGGNQERGQRAGTLNVPAIVGLGKAAEIAKLEQWENAMQASKLRTILEQSLVDTCQALIHGDIKNRLPHVTNLYIPNQQASTLIANLPYLAIATGSACNSSKNEPSHVLLAMGKNAVEAGNSLRFSVGKQTTLNEIIKVITDIQAFISKSN